MQADNVVSIEDAPKKGRKERVPLQQRLDIFAMRFEDEILPRQLKHRAGLWYLYENGYWRLVSEASTDWYDVKLVMADIATKTGFTPATDLEMLIRHLVLT